MENSQKNESLAATTVRPATQPLESRPSSPHRTASDFLESSSIHHSQHLSLSNGYDIGNPHDESVHYGPPFAALPTPPSRRPPSEPIEPTVEPPTPIEGSNSFGPEPNSNGKLRKSHKSQGQLKPKPLDLASSVSPLSSPEMRGRTRTSSGHNLTPPPVFSDLGNGNVTVSSPSSVPTPYYHSDGGSSEGTAKLSKRRSWLPGGKRRASKALANAPKAWILGMDGGGTPYDTQVLLNAQRVPELWDESGDVYVYLFPQSSGKGPSFKVQSTAISASRQLIDSAFGGSFNSLARRLSLNIEEATRQFYIGGDSPPPSAQSQSSVYSQDSVRGVDQNQEGHLYFPGNKEGSTGQDEEYLLSVRNLFAFLACQPLVATKLHPTVFSVFNMIAAHLLNLGFTNIDGSTFGETSTVSFAYVMEAFQLADMRHSREKTLEGIILGERMKCQELYNEAFSHAVGKYDELQAMKSLLLSSVSASTRSRLERGWIDLEQRKQAVSVRIENFEFPALFSGVAASTSSDDSKLVRYKMWKQHFLSMRKHFMSYQKERYGAWPPRASSKKNTFSYSGLNRLVLRNLYLDLCTLYDLLADRSSLTTRSSESGSDPNRPEDPIQAALRRLLLESDSSSPPVQPPIPFDVPRLPTMVTLEPNLAEKSPKVQHQSNTRELKDYEMKLLLARSHNLDSVLDTPFLRFYQELEEKEAKGKNASELAEMRIGYWLFVYVVIQSLPMLVVDTPRLKFAMGVETFLCIPAKGLVPWMEDGTAVKRNWYGVVGGQGMVHLPSDVVEYGVEGIYTASHCWVVADSWARGLAGMDPDIHEHAMSPVDPPSNVFGQWGDVRGSGSERSTSRSDRGRSRHRLSMTLEQLPLDFDDPPVTSEDTSYDDMWNNPQAEGYEQYENRPLPSPKVPQHGQFYSGEWSTPPPPQSTSPNLQHNHTASDRVNQVERCQGRPSSQVRTPSRHNLESPSPRTSSRSGPEREAKGFDDILADMSSENSKDGKKDKKKDKKDRRKSFLPF